jgi:hypothetical protein
LVGSLAVLPHYRGRQTIISSYLDLIGMELNFNQSVLQLNQRRLDLATERLVGKAVNQEVTFQFEETKQVSVKTSRINTHSI